MGSWNLRERVVRLYFSQPVLQRRRFFHGEKLEGSAIPDILWLGPDGKEMTPEAWDVPFVRCLGVQLYGQHVDVNEHGEPIDGDTLLILFNGDQKVEIPFVLPPFDGKSQWQRLLDTADPKADERMFAIGEKYALRSCSVVIMRANGTEAQAGAVQAPGAATSEPQAQAAPGQAPTATASAAAAPPVVQQPSVSAPAARQFHRTNRKIRLRVVICRSKRWASPAAKWSIAKGRLVMEPQELGRRRVVIEGVTPQVDSGRFPIKRVVGDEVAVEADVFADGHEEIACLLEHRHECEATWHHTPMQPLGNDRWRASFWMEELGLYFYRIVGWVDRFQTWRHDLKKRADAGQNLEVDLQIGAKLVQDASKQSGDRETAAQLDDFAARLAGENLLGPDEQVDSYAAAMDDALVILMESCADRSLATTSLEFGIVVDEPKAVFSAWYELFPRSYSPTPGEHGTLRDLIEHLPYVASMGFDVLYLPPVHPVGNCVSQGKE